MSEFVNLIISAALGAIAAIPVANWRLKTLEQAREDDQRKKERTHNEIWQAVHTLEKAFAAHELKAVHNLLEIEKRFSQFTVNEAKVDGRLSNIESGVARTEKRIEELLEEIKNK